MALAWILCLNLACPSQSKFQLQPIFIPRGNVPIPPPGNFLRIYTPGTSEISHSFVPITPEIITRYIRCRKCGEYWAIRISFTQEEFERIGAIYDPKDVMTKYETDNNLLPKSINFSDIWSYLSVHGSVPAHQGSASAALIDRITDIPPLPEISSEISCGIFRRGRRSYRESSLKCVVCNKINSETVKRLPCGCNVHPNCAKNHAPH